MSCKGSGGDAGLFVDLRHTQSGAPPQRPPRWRGPPLIN